MRNRKQRVTPWIVPVAAGLLSLLPGCESKKTTPPPVPAEAPPAVQPAASTVPAPARPLGTPTGTFIDREKPTDLRLVTYNIEWNSIFPDAEPSTTPKFARLVAALNPDILAVQEIGSSPRDRNKPGARKRTADDVRRLLDQIAPLPGGGTWYAYQGSDCVIASKYPLKMTSDRTDPPAQKELAMALVDLPDDRFKFDFYVLNNHYKCCDPEQFDKLRQQQSDGLVNWLRDARTPGGKIDLPPGTAIAVVGDLNIVGSTQPVTTLVDGDIQDEQQYGADSPPDWDDSPLVDAHPLHNVVGPDDWTWRDEKQEKDRGFKPSRMDYVIYTDSVLTAVKKFALITTTMSEADLKAAGLQKLDVAKDEVGATFDHLPLVVDFRPATAP